MKVYCARSGVTFTVDHFGNTSLEGVHPIFYAPVKVLLSRTTDWAAGKLAPMERKLLFLALFNSTDLVEFRATAQPSEATVQLNMEALIRFVGWHNVLSNPAIAFPRFVISHDTKDLSNCKHWLQSWYDAKKDFEDGYKSYGTATKLRNREVALERMIKNAQKTTSDYSKLLAIWAFEAAAVPEVLHEYWLELFCLKGLAVYQAKYADLDELVEHMEEYLEHGSIYATATLKHVRLLRAKNRSGLGHSLGLSSEELEKIDFEATMSAPFQIIEDEILSYNTKLGAAGAPENEPQQKDYPNRLAYLRARSAWQLADHAKGYADDAFKQDDIRSLAVDSDNITLEEESEIQQTEDGNILSQFGEEDDDTDSK